MPRTIKTWRDPYGEGFSTCRRREIAMNPGLTVLVGCNGAGKTTMLNNIEAVLKKEKIPCKSYNALVEGTNSIGSMFFNEEMELAAGLMTASEGEAQNINIGIFSAGLREFIRTGKYNSGRKEDRLAEIFMSEERKKAENERPVPKERWILLDASTSGVSIDSILEIKGLISLMKEDAESMGIELYVIVATNEYEMANGEECLDVMTGCYKTFKTYNSYRKFILKSREQKNRRTEKANAKKRDGK